jgi:hypothetical protein
MNHNRLDVKVYAVEPSDWEAFKLYLQEYQRTDQPPSPPGKLVRDEVLRIEAPSDKLTEVGIDLSDVLEGKFGHFIVIAKPPKGLFEQERYWEHVNVWVQVTQIGLDAFVDHSEMVAWTTSLTDGAPLPGLTIETAPGIRSGHRLGGWPRDLRQRDLPGGAPGDDRPSCRPTLSVVAVGCTLTEDEPRWYVIDARCTAGEGCVGALAPGTQAGR